MWADREDARRHWKDSARIPDATLDELLSAVFEPLVKFAPPLDPAAASIPWNYVHAQILAARDLYTAMQRDTGDVVGVGEYAVRVRELSSTVRQLLRPKRGRPGIG